MTVGIVPMACPMTCELVMEAVGDGCAYEYTGPG